MLVVAQAGESAKTKYLFDMHRLRKRVFNDRLRWDVKISDDDLEIDQFDIPEAVYVLSVNEEDRVIGSWRLLPANGPTMIRDIWPYFLNSIDMPSNSNVWESSRFAVDSSACDPERARLQIQKATQELFCGVAELCTMCGIDQLFAMHNLSVKRIAERVGCKPYSVSAPSEIDGQYAAVGAYRTNFGLLERIRYATGISHSLISPDALPPILSGRKRAVVANDPIPKMGISSVASMLPSAHEYPVIGNRITHQTTLNIQGAAHE